MGRRVLDVLKTLLCYLGYALVTESLKAILYYVLGLRFGYLKFFSRLLIFSRFSRVFTLVFDSNMLVSKNASENARKSENARTSKTQQNNA